MALKKSVKPDVAEQNAKELVAKGTPRKVARAIAANIRKAAKKKAAKAK